MAVYGIIYSLLKTFKEASAVQYIKGIIAWLVSLVICIGMSKDDTAGSGMSRHVEQDMISSILLD